ncbi:ABC transporter ATP-binding protein [Polymorphobacter sp.]|uniref:ABC transporter ATP-binding protein n=1 Tax=Polymorphobacter sp. TaxID=1909290 RepID=UPI003F6FD90D
MTAPLLALSDVGVRYGGHQALSALSFTVAPGEIVALIGESGSGKTTAARAIMGLVPVASGHIHFHGADTTHARGAARRALWAEMQMVFQDPSASLSPRLDVGAIIAEPLQAHGHATAAARSRAAALLVLVGLPASAIAARPTALSGGQRQRVAIARALALAPKLIVADEPMSALDVSVKAQIATLFLDIRDRTGTAFLIVAHDLALMAGIADSAVVLQGGRLVEAGPMAAMMTAPAQPYTRMLRDACLDPFAIVDAR